MEMAGGIVARLRAAGCVFAEEEARLLLNNASPGELDALVGRRVAGEPLEYILGWVEFCGLRVTVEPGVFVPRRRTEFLARRAISLAGPDAVVTELCCGCAAVAAAIRAARPRVRLYASDIDLAAVRCARRNLTGAEVFQGDLYRALPARLRGRIDVLVANAPYVPTAAIAMMPPEARDHEARAALDGGADGLAVLRRLVAEAPAWLAPGGHLLVETSRAQERQTAEIFTGSGLRPRMAHSGDATAVIGAPDSVGPVSAASRRGSR